MALLRVWVWGIAAWLVGCGGYSHTVRLVDGKPIDHRPISDAAYAAYANAARLEAAAQPRLALAAYREARSHDPDSVDIQTRIAALTCLLAPEAANDEFELALEVDAHYEALWREWALCELARGKRTRALRMAHRSLASAPDSLRASSTLAEIHIARQEAGEALRVLVAYVVRFPDDEAGWRVLQDAARRHGDRAWTRACALKLAERKGPEARPVDAKQDARAAVRHALSNSGLAAARAAAIDHRLSATDLGWLALSEQRPEAALAQAELVFAANPDDLEAALLGLLAAHDAGREATFRQWLAAMPARGTLNAVTGTARAEFVRLLGERLGRESGAALEHALEVAAPNETAP